MRELIIYEAGGKKSFILYVSETNENKASGYLFDYSEGKCHVRLSAYELY